LTEPIFITALSSISSLGKTATEIWENYKVQNHFLSTKVLKKPFDSSQKENNVFVGQLNETVNKEIEQLKLEDNKYKNLDNTVLFAIYVSRNALKQSNWKTTNFGVNFGSSRGATSLFEKYHAEFLESGKSSTLSSPTTTLGNISSWVAHDLQSSGPEISHSITCSTALHSLLNGIAWINAGMSDKFLVGGSEAPLTPFTIAQMQALKVYSKIEEADQLEPTSNLKLEKPHNFDQGDNLNYPCQAFNLDKTIIGIGYATEILKHNTSVSANAICFQKSMKMALGKYAINEIDAIVMHAPGTIKGDTSELNAIKEVFGDHMPFLTTNKWKIGHTFGASGLLSLELAILMLQHQEVIEVPFAKKQQKPKQLRKILVNAVGFGGNAVSVLLEK
jgi:3-oxoacyl-(acyl-carrier-protein) synthase